LSTLTPEQPRSTIFPYTTLFRSDLRPLGRDRGAAPLSESQLRRGGGRVLGRRALLQRSRILQQSRAGAAVPAGHELRLLPRRPADRKSTRLNSSHVKISYAVFCL